MISRLTKFVLITTVVQLMLLYNFFFLHFGNYMLLPELANLELLPCFFFFWVERSAFINDTRKSTPPDEKRKI